MPWNPEHYNVKKKEKKPTPSEEMQDKLEPILDDEKFYFQTYKSKNYLDEWSTVYYHGPLLDKRLFKNLKVDKKK